MSEARDCPRMGTVPLTDPRRMLENAVVRLLKSRPFYGPLLLGFRSFAAGRGDLAEPGPDQPA